MSSVQLNKRIVSTKMGLDRYSGYVDIYGLLHTVFASLTQGLPAI